MSAWIDVKTASDMLFVSPGELHDMRYQMQREGTWSIEWRANSADESVQDARGCGLLLLRADVERVAKIRRLCRCSSRQALRIYDAIARYGTL